MLHENALGDLTHWNVDVVHYSQLDIVEEVCRKQATFIKLQSMIVNEFEALLPFKHCLCLIPCKSHVHITVRNFWKSPSGCIVCIVLGIIAGHPSHVAA